ncbi:hypothetical protein V3331_07925 [Gaopeijia maritima]
MRGGWVSRVALAVAALLGALSLVAARQGKGLRVLSEVEALHSQLQLEQSREDELVSQIRHLESRGVIMARAEEELGMHPARDADLRFWPQVGP